MSATIELEMVVNQLRGRHDDNDPTSPQRHQADITLRYYAEGQSTTSIERWIKNRWQRAAQPDDVTKKTEIQPANVDTLMEATNPTEPMVRLPYVIIGVAAGLLALLSRIIVG